MSVFTGSLTVRKMPKKQDYRARLRIHRAALDDVVTYNFRCGSIQEVNKHALYIIFCDISNVDGLGLHEELDEAYKKTYSDVFNVLHGMVRKVDRRAYRGDVLDSLYSIHNVICTKGDDAKLTRAQCMEYCGEVSAYNRNNLNAQKTFIYRIAGGEVIEAYANGKRVYTMADVKRQHGSI